MLVLTRKASQAIQLGDDITITIIRTSHGSVKLGIQAPPDVRIARTELGEFLDAATLAANASGRELVAS